MKHLGDITKVNWDEVEPVDCVTGGSPCQDLSIAGKRAGLAGERSGLYMEQIRCVKELRKASGRTGKIRPRYMVWENVPGAFSSNGGKDFAAVLEEAVRIVEPEAPSIPAPAKWPGSGCLMGGGWSIAWRVHDAQFWGVPQRRKRIALVCDFGGHTAPEILFERKGLRGDTSEGRTAREGDRGTAEADFNPAVARSLTARADGSPCADRGPNIVCSPYHGGCDGGGKGALIQTEKSGTLGTGNDQAIFCLQGNCVAYGIGNGQANEAATMAQEVSQTLNTMHDKQAILYQPKSAMEENWAESETKNALRAGESKVSHAVLCEDVSHALRAKANCAYREDIETYPVQNMMARRLTPLECERLQGYPDGWTDIGKWIDDNGKKHQSSDSSRYKALGNSIALPFWFWLLRRISAQYERPATLGSLFDGIGGFPLCWERCNGKGTALWASEIEEFPIAVTKMRFGRKEE
nr:MAG TPA: Cytosine specific methyltransferase [Caudoviricetes sp.]